MSKKFRLRRPSPALIISIVALFAATAGTSYALGLSALSQAAKDKTVGVGKLTYVTSTTSTKANTTTAVTATCPPGLSIVGGGIKWTTPVAKDTVITDSYPITGAWAGHVYSGIDNSAITTAACAKSRVVTGAPPAS